MNPEMKIITWLTIFSIAMGYMESAVVIYLRELYFPGGFQFPLAPMEAKIGLVELLREAATIIMLAGIATLSAKMASLKFAYFIFCFAIWDLCYYLFLWIFLGWPESLFTWDILFLIPVPWVGPVVTPCIISITMILLALAIIYFERLELDTTLKTKEWILLSAGSILVFASFIWDYLKYMQANSTGFLNTASGKHKLLSELRDYVPVNFNWTLFLFGECVLLYGIQIYISRVKQQMHKTETTPLSL